MKNQHIRVYVVPYCGDVPCADEEEIAGALIVRRVTVDGNELVFSKAHIRADNDEILTLRIEFTPGKLEVLQMLDPWQDER